MPNQHVQPAPSLDHKPPTPASITPALLKTHSITADEYTRIEAALGRTPSLTELGIFSVMWSEHCSYKSSRVHLKRLPTKGPRTSGPGSVIQGPGENAGIIDVGDGWACAFKIESHNHPSYIEPYQGAATGVGGILRDIFTMGARPLAVMDSLRFGPLAPPPDFATDLGYRAEARPPSAESTAATTPYARNRHTLQGVVAGVGGYGNCFGVPNLGGETRFESCYSGNPLLNAFALGLVRTDEIFYAKAEGIGNPVFYVGAKTGRDGIHGATMASEEFTEGSEQKRPNVQMGDPFLEKLLLEACLEVMKTGAVLGIQDMGAAGLTCSTCEMGARGSLGVAIELDRVPQRETGMSSYEIMLSESQERMLLVAAKGREAEVLSIFTKWGLDCAEVGIVTADDVMRVFHHGVLEAEIPNKSLTDNAPLYHRPIGTWNPPVPRDPPPHILELLKQPRDYTADLKRLLASPNICSKKWIYEQYDSMVQTNTVQGPGGEAGVIRIKPHSHSIQTVILSAGEGSRESSPAIAINTLSTQSHPGSPPHIPDNPGAPSSAPSSPKVGSPTPERGLAMALAGNGRWCYLNPKLGAMHAVAEAARKVACTGATPVAATNCLNFGNPEKPEIMAQLSAAIDGIAEACTALGTPVTGGNVSLYNETSGVGIYPTPVIGVVGIFNDVTKAIPSSFQREGDTVLFLSAFRGTGRNAQRDLGASAFAQSLGLPLWGEPVVLDLDEEAILHKTLAALATRGLLRSATDISDGGFVTAAAKAALSHGLGAELATRTQSDEPLFFTEVLFAEIGSSVIATCDPAKLSDLQAVLTDFPGTYAAPLGSVTGSSLRVSINGRLVIDEPLTSLAHAYATALESQLAEEVRA